MSKSKSLLACVWLLSSAVAASAQELVTLPTRQGVSQSYFVASLPQNPHAIGVLFAGGGGFIRIRREEEEVKFDSDNFLVRSYGEFAKRGVIAVIVDAPSDQQGDSGMTDDFRKGEQHFTDVNIVLTDLENRFGKVPLYLVGTSRGTVSAAVLGARFGQRLGGVVLSATMFSQTGRQSKEPGLGLSHFNFATIKVPLLFVHHVNDQCGVTPYSDAARLSNKFPLISVSGGLPPQSEACEALTPHGFFGKESETVEQIVNWMLKKPFREKVE